MSKKILLSICFLFAMLTTWSQTGTLKGTIFDKATGETIIGATVVIKGTTNGSITDFDGNYTLKLAPGKYDLQVSFVSYEANKITGVEVKEGEVTIVNSRLGEANIQLTEIVVTAKENKRSENSIMLLQKKSAKIVDGISAEQMSKLGDSNAADALKRVTGVSVQGGKYVFIRGLGDRYTKMTLNDAEIPGLDPKKNSVQMDLFPSNVIDNIMVNKTFTPDMPGESTGGHVNIITRDFPDKFTLVFSNSFAYNTQSSFNDKFITRETKKYDLFGMDGGERSIPSFASNMIDNMGNKDVIAPIAGYYTSNEVGAFTQSFGYDVVPIEKTSFMDHSHKLSIGDQISLGGKKALGYNIALTYSRTFDYFDDGRQSLYRDEIPSSNKDVSDRKGEENVILSGLLNLNFKLDHNNKIGLRVLRNQAGTKVGRYREGTYNYESGANIQDREISYLERNFNSLQLHGKHVFKNLNNSIIDWLSSYTFMKQLEPDAVFFSNLFFEGSGETNFAFKTNELPNRLYRDMSELDFDNKINIEIPVELFSKKDKIKFGVSYLYKDRQADLEKIEIRPNFNTSYTGNFELDGNIPSFLEENIISNSNENGGYNLYDVENNLLNSYSATAKFLAPYFMFDFLVVEKFRVLGGVRFESSDMQTKNGSAKTPKTGEILKNDFLPSLNLTYTLANNMNVRLAYSQTIARPQFREFAPTSFYDYKLGMRIIGNDSLDRSKINNVDLRWEYYFKPGEMVAFSGFYKTFEGAIEPSLDPTSQNFIVKYVNTDNAYLYGLELELRKSLGFIDFLSNFNIGGNLTLVKSSVELSEEDKALRNKDSREMVGQAPYVANAYLGYQNEEAKLSANVGFNINGKKMTIVTSQTTPYIYEEPRPMVNFNITKGIGKHFEVEFSVDNILNSEYKAVYDYPEEYGRLYNVKYSEGVTFGAKIKYFIK